MSTNTQNAHGPARSSDARGLPPLGITGASGNVGGTVARVLAEAGIPMRLLANTPSRAPQLPGAAAEAGVRHIVYLSFMNAAPDCVFTLGRTHFHTEEHIKASGMAWTFLRDNFYIDFFVDLPDEEGIIRGPAGDGRVGAVARSDAGRVAAAVLRDPGRHVGRTLNVTGPSSLTLDEIAEILTGALGRPIRYERETVDEAYESRKKWPVEQWQYDAWVSTYTSIAAGQMDVVSTVVEDLTGRPPLNVRDVAEGRG